MPPTIRGSRDGTMRAMTTETDEGYLRPIGVGRDVPIADYGFLSDGEATALVSPGGVVDWMCAPRMDSPSVFGALLGPHAGRFSLTPSDVVVPSARRYLPGTMILETSWGTPTGWIIVRDLLVIGPWHHEQERSKTLRRTPSTSCCGRSAA